ncbi:MAG: hydrogenase iron-sulfur subunit [Armatimonadota bacterium]|nr:hydrogenase iron-sulfur subunit [Armatimonadota bacterium]MDR7439153.1 hydrogenase iron-sulfur subunit [Armatimonadota bacterium]MDR7563018.1 hydrogenase iron-sulfur subunit [Armatimonadota bacterium]MDR7567669.1 hydrogenase iron-sulfur subunit [Armatimonadota bacterium]MDR7600862.1 hydrogenase iron-sulfur subunit [Armatimonadota bacterium]
MARPQMTERTESERTLRVVGFLCDWAVSGEGLLNPDGTMRDCPEVTLIAVPCSGFVRPAWLELALRGGAAGTFVCGCPMGDCLNREGNWIMEARIDQLRKRLQRQRVDPQRVAFFAYGLHDREAFVAAVRDFVEKIRSLLPAGGKR